MGLYKKRFYVSLYSMNKYLNIFTKIFISLNQKKIEK